MVFVCIVVYIKEQLEMVRHVEMNSVRKDKSCSMMVLVLIVKFTPEQVMMAKSAFLISVQTDKSY